MHQGRGSPSSRRKNWKGIVAAGSVVKRNVPPGMLVSGNPARIVGKANLLFDSSSVE